MTMRVTKYTLFMETKTSKAVELLRGGRIREALAIFRTFRMGFTSDERRTIQIASESMSGHSRFYESLGISVVAEQQKAVEILTKKYL